MLNWFKLNQKQVTKLYKRRPDLKGYCFSVNLVLPEGMGDVQVIDENGTSLGNITVKEAWAL